MEYSFIDLQQNLSIEHGVDFKPCQVGAHYVHGKVERKINRLKNLYKQHEHGKTQLFSGKLLCSKFQIALIICPLV